MAASIVLELPGKGSFAPNKIGSRYGRFLRSKIKGEVRDSWIFEGKIYSMESEADVKEFNAMCAEVIPNCHRRRLRAVPRIILTPDEEKPKKAKKAAKKSASKQKEKVTPKAPTLISPPLTED